MLEPGKEINLWSTPTNDDFIGDRLSQAARSFLHNDQYMHLYRALRVSMHTSLESIREEDPLSYWGSR